MLREAYIQFFQKVNLNKRNYIFLILALILVCMRFVWLDRFPVGINHDEVDVILSAKSYIKYGTDLSGSSFPKSLFATNTEAGLAGLPSFLMAPYYGFIKINMTSARIPAVVVGLLLGISVSYLLYVTTKNKFVTTISILVGLVSPWLFFYGRAPTESPWALLLLLLGVIFFYTKPKSFFLSLPFFIASFYSYQGAKITIPVFVTLFLLTQVIKDNKKRFKNYIVYFILFLSSTGIFFVYSFNQTSTYNDRSKEIIFNHMDQVSVKVDELRRDSIITPLTPLIFNKYTVLFTEMSKKYLYFYSPEFWFFRGDQAVLFEDAGITLLPDALFIVLGIIALSRISMVKYNTGYSFLKIVLALFLVVAPAASSVSVNSNQYLFRAFSAVPVVIILASFGVEYLLLKFRQPLVLLAVIAVYLIFFLNFLYFFFFRYSVSEQENHFLSERVLASYLFRVGNSQGGKIYIVSQKPQRAYYEYLFFSNKLDQNVILPKVNDGDLEIENFVFTNKCQLSKEMSAIISPSSGCHNFTGAHLAIQNKQDTGTIFRIYNDKLCNGLSLQSYRRFHLISDYNIESLDNGKFCERWIGKYDN